MRTRVLQTNQRIKIGEDTPPLGGEWCTMARVLGRVGLTLEIEYIGPHNRVALFAARRSVTHDISPSVKAPSVTPVEKSVERPVAVG